MYKPTLDHSRRSAHVTWFLIEWLVYAVFIFAYYFLVLRFLGGWLKRLFDDHRAVYAVMSLALITAQGVLLQLLTGWLLSIIRGKGK